MGAPSYVSRRPEMEWHRGDLETEPDQGEQHRQTEGAAVQQIRRGRPDALVRHRPREAVQEGHAVQEDGGREDPENEELE